MIEKDFAKWQVFKKTFNGKEVSPIDTTGLASSKYSSWKVTQLVVEATDRIDGNAQDRVYGPT